MRLMRSWFTYLALAVLSVIALLFWRVLDHDLDRHPSEDITVSVQGESIAATLWRPQEDIVAVVALVHGDGPQDRTSAGGYAPIINELLGDQIAVVAWDKPGVGESTGNWLDQSMADRADVLRAVAASLKERFGETPIGALGFSQAGWVVPQLDKNDIDFAVLVGPAVSWKDQGVYYTRMRLMREGASAAEIEETLQKDAVQYEHIFGPNAVPGDAPPGMASDRWSFIKRNRDVDVRDLLGGVNTPLLAIWGADDLNVDAVADIAIYRSFKPGLPASSNLILLRNATHGLLKSQHYNWQLNDQWPWHAKLRFFLEGRHAFAPGALDAITDWIGQITDN